jgi:hypothetical protein
MSKISRELFRSSNNEALEQQLNVQRKFIDRMREAQQLFSEEYKRATGINENLKDEINKIILSFRATLDEFVNKLESDEPLKNAGIIIYRYNLLANGLKKLGYITLPITQKQEFTEELNDMIPKLEELIRYAEINNFTDLEQLKEIVNNFITGVFRTIGISSVKYTQGLFMEGREAYNKMASDIMTIHDTLKTSQLNNLYELTDDEKASLQHEINSIRKIGTKMKSEKNITPAINDRLKKSKETLTKILKDASARGLKQILEEEQAREQAQIDAQVQAEEPYDYQVGQMWRPRYEPDDYNIQDYGNIYQRPPEQAQGADNEEQNIYYTYPEFRNALQAMGDTKTSRYYWGLYKNSQIEKGVSPFLFR